MADDVVTPSPLMLVMNQLATCVCTELTEHGAGQTCWCGIWPGDEVAWEFCGDCSNNRCGMGWVRVTGAFPYETFPVPSIGFQCRLPLTYSIEVGALRCMPISDNEGELPTPADIGATALDTYADMAALYTALKCCDAAEIAVEAWVPVGPQGGCVGGVWGAYITLDQ